MKPDKNVTWYLAGPMRPHADHNFPLFERATKMLRAAGYDIVSPHEFGDAAKSRGELMTEDFMLILLQCGGIITLPDFELSPGANAEVAVAFAAEMPVFRMVFVGDDDFVLLDPVTVAVTVVREQQYAEGWPLIGLCGYAQAGKDTLAHHLVQDRGFTRVAFADKLRDVLYALDPVAEYPQFVEEDAIATVREIVDEMGWDLAKTTYEEIRTLLQRLGTEAGRDNIDQQLWVREGEKKIELAGGPVVLTDCRFQNEIQMVRRRKGKLIWIDRPGNEPANAHASEHSVTKDDCDYVLLNDGTIVEFYRQADNLLHAWNMYDPRKDSQWGNETGTESALTVAA